MVVYSVKAYQETGKQCLAADCSQPGIVPLFFGVYYEFYRQQRCQPEAAEAYEALGIEVVPIGDCLKAGTLLDTALTGYFAAQQL